MATQDDLFFRDALARKYDILQQQANTASQDVTQKPQMQGAADAAALERARLAAQTQLGAEQLRGGFGLEQQSMAGQSAANVANIHGGFGLQQQTIAGQNAANVANIQGGWGLEDAKTRAGAMQQPMFDAMPNPDYDSRKPGSQQFVLAPKNASGMDYLNLRKPQAPAMPQGLGVPQGATSPGPAPVAAAAPAVSAGTAPAVATGQPGFGLPKLPASSDRYSFDYGQGVGGGLPGPDKPFPTFQSPVEALRESIQRKQPQVW